MIDLHDLLKEQLQYIPVHKDRYLFDPAEEQFYVRRHCKVVPITGVVRYTSEEDRDIFLTLSDGKHKKISKFRLLCYFQNGLKDGMKSLTDPKFLPRREKDGCFNWMSVSDVKMAFNRERLAEVFRTHPELQEKDGFFDEGPIPFKPCHGFFIVPLTNGTLAINPYSQEAIYTYSGERLKPQFHERGDCKYVCNKRLGVLSKTMLASRAIAYITKPVPEKHRIPGEKIRDTVARLEVDHIDANPRNNSVDNLQYLTPQENLIKKLEQEMDPHVLPTTWKAPDGKVHRFRSVREASKRMGCGLVAIGKICKGWRNLNEINGWVLLEGKVTHPLEWCYQFFEDRGVARSKLSRYGQSVLTIDIQKKTSMAYGSLKDAVKAHNLNLSAVESRIGITGPLSPYNGVLFIPAKYFGVLTQSKLIEFYCSQ